ncbi:unnamed protein product [Cuscuta campestris]|uniref:Uncharacterized protein n=1 Tax=Cuscuta campestris TaxID=132261 RepID=A0A484NH11_9ASTE|nr:unnamed protein product [Cuscuta campestris]
MSYNLSFSPSFSFYYQLFQSEEDPSLPSQKVLHEEMEKENIEPKPRTIQGEKAKKNTAFEVDLDFEHNMRLAPVITEEVTLSLEELSRKRIVEVDEEPSIGENAFFILHVEGTATSHRVVRHIGGTSWPGMPPAFDLLYY